MNLYGLIGFPLTHSFSKKYFTETVFPREGRLNDSKYELFEIEDAAQVLEVIKANPNLRGLNVTIPHKENVLKYLDEIDPAAKEIGAVNVIKIENGKRKGYNSDYYGFLESLNNLIISKDNNESRGDNLYKALILGTGGASKAVEAVVIKGLDNYPISNYRFVSRKKPSMPNAITYEELFEKENEKLFKSSKLIINTTPLGMHPNIETYPNIPYHLLTPEHFLFDLVYNPEETTFMKKGNEMGAKTKNGLEMLHLQAEKAWEIWNS